MIALYLWGSVFLASAATIARKLVRLRKTIRSFESDTLKLDRVTPGSVLFTCRDLKVRVGFFFDSDHS